MSEYLFEYHPVHPTTWVYLSSLLMLGVFFKFSRFWSVRNIDLVLLILLAPGLLMVQLGKERAGEDQVAKELASISAEFVEVVDAGAQVRVEGVVDLVAPLLFDERF